MNELRSVSTYVSSAEFVRNFAGVRDSTARGPVIIKNHGRDTHVLLSVDQYVALSTTGSEAAAGPNPLTELGNWLTDAIIQCDRAMTILQVNRVAEALLRRSAEELVGTALDAIPEIAASHLMSIIERTNTTNEPETVEIVSPFATDGWLRFRCLPWRNRNVLMFRDITDATHGQRLAETKAAIIDAMNVHGSVGYARVSLRGIIDRTDTPFARMLGLAEDRILGAPLVNLVTKTDRVSVRDALENAIENRGSHRLSVSFVANGGQAVPVTLAIVPIVGARGVAGAVAVMTPAE